MTEMGLQTAKGPQIRTVVMASPHLKIIALMVILLASASGATAGEDIALLRAREGAAALLRGQFDKAIEAYDRALATPDIADFTKATIYSDRGIAKWRLKQTKEALADFNQSIQLSAENPPVFNNRGNALMDLGHPEEALKDFDRAIALSANYGAAYNNRGNAHTALGQFEQAFQDFRKAVELMPTNAVPVNGRGMAHAALSRYHAAVRDYSRALSLNTRYGPAYRNRGEAHLALDQFDKAKADLTQALEIESDDPELLILRARAQRGAKKLKAAHADLDKAIELNPDSAEAYIERGIVFNQLRRYESAVEDYSRAVVIDSDNARAYAMRAVAKREIEAKAPKPKPKPKPKAETVVAKPKPETVVAKPEPGSDAAGAAASETGDAAAGEETPGDVPAGVVPASEAETGEAATYEATAVVVNAVIPLIPPYTEALSDADKALALAPDDAVALRIRGDIYLAMEQIPEAIADYRRALAQDPFQSESRKALVKLDQDPPPEPEAGPPLDEPVSGWVVKESIPGRYVATNPKYRRVKAELEMFGAGKPRILEWSLLKSGFSGIGLLRYYAGDQGNDTNLEYVAIVDLRTNRVISIEPHSWGQTPATWTWQQASVVVTDPEGNANEIKLRRARATRRVAPDEGGFFGFGRASPQKQKRGRSRRSRRGGGGDSNILDWLFR